MTLFLISFLAGLLTILAPCILPFLPIIIGGATSDGGGKYKKALTIIGALGVSVIIFTVLLKASTLLITIPPEVWGYISGGLLVVLGIVTIRPSLWSRIKLNSFLSQKSSRALAIGASKKSFKGDIVTGFALGPVFTTCSPTYFVVIATVLPSAPVLGFVYLLAFVFGLMISLLAVATLGQKVVDKLGLASDPRGWFKKMIGILFIAVGVTIFFGLDKDLETYLLDESGVNFSGFEQGLLDKYIKE